MEEIQYMNVAQYCLNTLQKNLKTFFEMNHKELIKLQYETAQLNSYDTLFYLNVLKNYADKINLPRNVVNIAFNLRIFRNKIAHQVPISLRELYRYVDDTEFLLEIIKVYQQEEMNNIENARKEIIKRMCNCNDNMIIIGINSTNNSSSMNNYNIDEDIDMQENYDNYGTNSNNNVYNNCNFNSNFNNFNNNNINNNIISEEMIKEKERQEKINKNYEAIMKNNDPGNFMKVNQQNFK